MKNKNNIIPKNLEECIITLEKNLSKKEIEALKNGILTPISLHSSLGMAIRNNWGLWQDSELKKWFNNLGIQHPDDMSGIILKSFVNHLKGEKIDLDGMITYYKGYWGKERK